MDLKNIIWDDEFLFPVDLSVDNDEIVKIRLYSIQIQNGDKKEHHLPKYSLLGECEEPYSLFCHKSGIKQWMQVAPSLRKSDPLPAVSEKSQVKKPSLGSLLVWSKLMYEGECGDMKQNQTEMQELRQEILGEKHYLTTKKATKHAQQYILPPISISGSVTRSLINDLTRLDSSTISFPPTLGHSPSQCNSHAPSPPLPKQSQQFFSTQLNSPTEINSAVINGRFPKKNYEKRKSNLERIYSRMDITDNNKLDFVPKEK
ncbi:hypothetical protein FGO68_gene8587 [Halteria grandinella]|uniref:Uncharacterized protein n=1 Tax=Halteria grandinella TaxID=5974 RepID=A0A8J8NWS0_HALGN|nr:hypothetical protein FGO68_gene8587 [Halteria grandinella]